MSGSGVPAFYRGWGRSGSSSIQFHPTRTQVPCWAEDKVRCAAGLQQRTRQPAQVRALVDLDGSIASDTAWRGLSQDRHQAQDDER